VAAATVHNTPDDGRKTASETCRVITPNTRGKRSCISLVFIWL